MPYASFPTTGRQRVYLRDDINESGGSVTNWSEAGGGANATLEGAAPGYSSDALGDGTGPGVDCVSELGLASDYTAASTTWKVGIAVRPDSVSGFDNMVGDSGSTDFGVYLNNGVIVVQEGATMETTTVSLSAGTLYILIIESNGTDHDVYAVEPDTIADTATALTPDYTTTLATPSQLPQWTIASYGGSAAPDAVFTTWGIYSTTGDIFSFYNALREDATRTYIRAPIDTSAVSDSIIAELDADPAIERSGSDAVLSVDATVIALEYDRTLSDSVSLADAVVAGLGIEVVDAVEISDVAALALSYDRSQVDTASVADAVLVEGGPSFDISAADAVAVAEVAVASTVYDRISDVLDSFNGSGPLSSAWSVIDSAALPGVTQTSGRYLAELDDNTADRTLWFNANTGRLDYFWIAPGTELIYTNIGIGASSGSTQTPPSTSGDPVIFAGPHLNSDPASPTDHSVHAVVGHRGGVHYTIETKETTSGVSTVADEGFNVLGGVTRADVRVVYNTNGDIDAYWRDANSSGSWNAITWPAGTPNMGINGTYAGAITYAAGTTGVPFVGTCDGVRILGPDLALAADSVLAELVATLTRSGNDNVALADALTTAVEHERAAADTFTAGDSAAVELSIDVLGSDLLSFIDSVQVDLGIAGSGADGVGVDDGLALAMSLGRLGNDPASVSDAAIAIIVSSNPTLPDQVSGSVWPKSIVTGLVSV